MDSFEQPLEDVLEQRREIAVERAPADDLPDELPLEADTADVMEQSHVVVFDADD